MTITLSAFQQQRRDTAANWTSQNPTLKVGEIGFETDTKYLKIGDGSTAWTSLAYIHGSKVSAYPLATADLADGAVTSAKLENNITIAGNLTVNGTTTTIDTTTLVVEDKNIEIGKVSTPSDTTADGGGITLKGASDKTINWVQSTGCWTFNQPMDFNNHVRIDSAGKLGVGTTAPKRDLHLNGGSGAVKLQITNTGTGSSTDGDGFQIGIGTDGTAGIEQRENKDLTFSTNNTERTRITSDGKLLAGLSSSVDSSQVQINFSTSLNRGSNATGLGANIGVLKFADARANSIYGEIRCQADGTPGTDDYPGRLTFSTTADGDSTTTERLRITSAGLVGIGTSSPVRQLSVNDFSGNGTVSINAGTNNASTLYFADAASGNGVFTGFIQYNHSSNAMQFAVNDGVERMRLTSTGQFLVGTTSGYATTASIHGNAAATSTGTGSYVVMTVGDTNTGAQGVGGGIGFLGNDGINGQVTFSQIQGFKENGNVGDFSGGLRFHTRVSGNALAERVRIDSSGRVGIGTNSPTQPLTLHGNFRINTSNADGNEQRALFNAGGSGDPFSITMYDADATTAGITLSGNGDVTAAGKITSQGNAGAGAADGSIIDGQSGFSASIGNASSFLYRAYTTGNSTPTFSVTADGTVTAAGAANAAQFFATVTGDYAFRSNSRGGYFIHSNGDEALYIRNASDSNPVITLDSADASISAAGTISTRISDSIDVGFYVSNSDVAFNKIQGRVFEVDNGGTVCIGGSAGSSLASYTSPNIKLDTNGSITAAGTLTLNKNYGSNPSGNVKTLVINSGGTNSSGAMSEKIAMFADGSIATVGDVVFKESTTNAFSLKITGANGQLRIRDEYNSSDRVALENTGALFLHHLDSEISVASSSTDDTGVSLNGGNASHYNIFASDNATTMYIGRQTSDGTLIDFRQGGTQEGSISVSGSSVTLNGGHLSRWSQLPGLSNTDTSARPTIYRGTVMSNLDEMCEWSWDAQDAVLYTEKDELPKGVSVGDIKTPAVAAGKEDNQQLNRTKVSDVEGDPDVAGVFFEWDDTVPPQGESHDYKNDFYVSMTGDMVIRIAKETTVARGDLLMSAGDGTAKPQDDDIVRSKTIAKVTSTTVSETYSDGSYCVPCVLMAC